MQLRKALISTALASTLVVAGCERAADGAIEVDKLEGCVNVATGTVRSAHLGCRAGEELVRFKGEAGAKGAAGAAGSKGDKGDAGPVGAKGETGPAGAKGDTGDKGDAGTNGTSTNGTNGASAFDIWRAADLPARADSTTADYLTAIRGATGPAGPAGTSLYKLTAVDNQANTITQIVAGDVVTLVQADADCIVTVGGAPINSPGDIAVANATSTLQCTNANTAAFVRVDRASEVSLGVS